MAAAVPLKAVGAIALIDFVSPAVENGVIQGFETVTERYPRVVEAIAIRCEGVGNK